MGAAGMNDVCEWLSMMESTMMKKKACIEVKTSLDHWRDQWLGHPLIKVISHVLSQINLPIPMSKSKFSFCDSCNSNKSHEPLFSVLESYSLLDLIYFDIRGHPIYSMDGLSYFVIFVDYFIKYSWLFPMTHKYYIFFQDLKLWSKCFLKHLLTQYIWTWKKNIKA